MRAFRTHLGGIDGQVGLDNPEDERQAGWRSGSPGQVWVAATKESMTMEDVIDWVWNDMPVWLAALLFSLFVLAVFGFLSRATPTKKQ
jgi:hypothetical protein